MTPDSSPLGLANLGPIAQLRAGRLPERLVRLLAGLWLYGVSNALLMQSTLGGSPWVVFHQGASRHLPLSLGMVMVSVAVAVLLLWIPLRQMPGLGTVANTFLLGPFTDLNLHWLAAPESLPLRCAYLIGGVAMCALATALYVGAQLGTGPRDGLMTGFARRTGWSIRRVRTSIEIVVLACGVALGGVAGLGTLVFALCVGPITQFFMRYLVLRLEAPEEKLPAAVS
ncbi:hypothetical protein J5226_01690 [Lysobacter sp. K5869]|uniref:membrane protein YczE n=1 Tax=Lysobacter sp. K5869 TaxID=2820808 RepID=UPI001C060F5E|nr:hypothetical protein [Lysobacter sp. K5869]QWP77144.1 hypothetical protein J5226_01690 [Lysobacter sp. K5869]